MDANVSTPWTFPTRRATLLALALALLSGCAGGGPLGERRTMLGTLRSNVAQLESEKYRLQKDLAQVRADHRDLEDRLVREQADNQAMARQIDDLRRVARGEGFESAGIDPMDLSRGEAADPFATAPEPSRRSAPVSQPRGRKVPFAQIPGPIRPLPDDRGGFSAPPAQDDEFRGSDLFPPADDLGSRDEFRTSRARWLPVARGGFGGSGTRVR